MRLVTVQQLAKEYGLPIDRIRKLLTKIPVDQYGKQNKSFYQSKNARAIIEKYISEKSGPPPGLATLTDIRQYHGVSVQTMKRMRMHPDMPKPAGKWRVKTGVFCDHYSIEDVVKFSQKNTWLIKPKQFYESRNQDDDVPYAIPKAPMINPWAAAFVRWDFNSPLRLS
jgi:hypothetical protein